MKMFYIIIAVIICFVSVAFFTKYYFFRVGKAINKEVSDSYYKHSVKNKIIWAPMGNWFELGYRELDADVDSFTVMAKNFGEDKDSIFWNGVKQNVDYTSFEVGVKDSIIKDKNHVYTTTNEKGDQQLGIIESADPASYVLLYPDLSGYARYYWHRDVKNIYYKDQIIANADLKSFEMLDQWYSKDEKNVYFENKVLPGANPKTFKKSSTPNVWEDGSNQYANGVVVAK